MRRGGVTKWVPMVFYSKQGSPQFSIILFVESTDRHKKIGQLSVLKHQT